MEIPEMSRFLFPLLLFSLLTTQGTAEEIFVGPKESLKTVGQAIESAEPGDTVHVRKGIYIEKVVIETDDLTLKAEKGAVIHGSRLGHTRGGESPLALVTIKANDIVLEGFEVSNLWTTQKNQTAVGILVKPGSQRVTIRNCHIRNLGSSFVPEWEDGWDGRDAHGILVEARSYNPTIRDVRIEGNTLEDLQLGSSEALVVNGNVDGFWIANNIVRRCDNIGIDLIGYEDKDLVDTNRARNGLVYGNSVSDCSTYTGKNPSYWEEAPEKDEDQRQFTSTCAGIYVDGGKDIKIWGNQVRDCDYGIEVTSEWAGKYSENISVHNNLFIHNVKAGITIGGAEDERDGDKIVRVHGGTKECHFTQNTLINNDYLPDDPGLNGAKQYDEEGELEVDWNGQVQLQLHIENCSFSDNIFATEFPKADGTYVMMSILQKAEPTQAVVSFSHNQHYCPEKENGAWGWPEGESWETHQDHAKSDIFVESISTMREGL